MGIIERRHYIFGCDMLAAYIVEVAIIRLANHSIDGNDGLITGLIQGVANESVQSCAHAQRIGQDDGSFQRAEFPDLGAAGQFAEAVADVDTGRYLFLK